MFETFIHSLKSSIPDYESKSYLLAVSGGVDSMVMLSLFAQANLKYQVSHINHAKRAEESDKDEDLVERIANKLNVKFHQKRLGKCSKGNFQEWARNQRYEQWQQILRHENIDYICTAHHKDDSIETFLMNLMRGSGLNGLTGINNNSHIIRPLLGFTKEQITAYADRNKVEYREDASNAENTYLRNYIRNELLVAIVDRIPNAKLGLNKSMNILKSEQALLQKLVSKQIEARSEFRKGRLHTRIELEEYENEVELMYQNYRKYGFHRNQIEDILTADTGSEIYSATHVILRNRKELISDQTHHRDQTYKELTINKSGFYNWIHNVTIEVSDVKVNNSITLDANHLPVTIRSWRKGDSFAPLGMQGKKQKVKDYLTNIKLDKWSKQETPVIEKDSVILGIIPYRAAHTATHETSREKVYVSIADNR